MAGTLTYNESTASPLSQRRILIIFGGLLLGMLLGSLDQTIVSTALPTIISDLGGLNELSWVVTAYLLASTASMQLWGKLGDLYGRKRLYQVSIGIFLVGSALSGLSQNIVELIAFRALQGLGGGGLIVISQAIVGDIVSPRDRGRYQGIFGAVFGVSSVAGPLLGGFFVDNLSWRWVFYINLPIGIIALLVTAIVLPAGSQQRHPSIDYLGTILLAGASTTLILFTSAAGSIYAWNSAPIILLVIATIAMVAAFIFVEQRAAEPLLPLPLFRNQSFSMCSIIGFIVGFAMFGSITYLPLYLQVVKGASPLYSGLELIPLMAGVLITSTISGQLISRWGRYKMFPIVGTAVFTLGLFLFSRMDENTGIVVTSLYMLILGLGLGMVMQVLVLIVQNAVDYHYLGTATSGVTFFRSIGSAFGVAVFGSIFASNLASNLAQYLPKGELPAGFNASNIQSQHLPAAVHSGYIHAYAASLQTVFLIAVPIGLIAFILSWFLKEEALKSTASTTDTGHTYAIPTAQTSLEEITRSLAVLASRESRDRIYKRIADRAGLALTPPATWLLFRLDAKAPVSLQRISERCHVSSSALQDPLNQLKHLNFVTSENRDDHRSSDMIALTSEGSRARDRLLAAEHEGLASLLNGWSPEQHNELATMLHRLAEDVLADERSDRVITEQQPALAAR